MHGRIPRLVLAAPLAAALAVTLTASGPVPRSGAADTPALRSISSRLDGAVSTVLIEASEPVAYLTSQPDPLTVLVDLRNVNAGGLGGNAGRRRCWRRLPAWRLKARARPMARRWRACACASIAPPSIACAARATPSSSRSIATRRLAARRAHRRPRPTLGADASAPQGAGGEPRRRSAVDARRGDRTALGQGGGDGRTASPSPSPATARWSPSSVEDARDLPARVFLDFQGVAAGRAAAVTAVNTAGIERVRVATNSREPLITRVVIDLARKIPYTIETVGEEIRVLFNRAVDASAALRAAGARRRSPPSPARAGAPNRGRRPPVGGPRGRRRRSTAPIVARAAGARRLLLPAGPGPGRACRAALAR